MSKQTIEVIIKVASEVFSWAISILREKTKSKEEENNDRNRDSKEK